MRGVSQILSHLAADDARNRFSRRKGAVWPSSSRLGPAPAPLVLGVREICEIVDKRYFVKKGPFVETRAFGVAARGAVNVCLDETLARPRDARDRSEGRLDRGTVIVRCVGASGDALPAACRNDSTGMTLDAEFPLLVDKNYVVYAMTVFDGSTWFYVLDEHGAPFPHWYPADLFTIEDERIPPDWVIGYVHARDGRAGYPVVSFPEWALDPSFYERLVDGSASAAETFARRRKSAESPAVPVHGLESTYSASPPRRRDVESAGTGKFAFDMHDDRAAISVRAEDRLDTGMAVSGFVVCHHEFGIGVYVGAHDQWAHVDVPHIQDGFLSGTNDYPAIATEVQGHVLGYSGSGQLRLSLRQR